MALYDLIKCLWQQAVQCTSKAVKGAVAENRSASTCPFWCPLNDSRNLPLLGELVIFAGRKKGVMTQKRKWECGTGVKS